MQLRISCQLFNVPVNKTVRCVYPEFGFVCTSVNFGKQLRFFSRNYTLWVEIKFRQFFLTHTTCCLTNQLIFAIPLTDFYKVLKVWFVDNVYELQKDNCNILNYCFSTYPFC